MTSAALLDACVLPSSASSPRKGAFFRGTFGSRDRRAMALVNRHLPAIRNCDRVIEVNSETLRSSSIGRKL